MRKFFKALLEGYLFGLVVAFFITGSAVVAMRIEKYFDSPMAFVFVLVMIVVTFAITIVRYFDV